MKKSISTPAAVAVIVVVVVTMIGLGWYYMNVKQMGVADNPVAPKDRQAGQGAGTVGFDIQKGSSRFK